MLYSLNLIIFLEPKSTTCPLQNLQNVLLNLAPFRLKMVRKTYFLVFISKKRSKIRYISPAPLISNFEFFFAPYVCSRFVLVCNHIFFVCRSLDFFSNQNFGGGGLGKCPNFEFRISNFLHHTLLAA